MTTPPDTQGMSGRQAQVSTYTETPLLATERCDRCGAQAHVRVIMLNGLDLLFCAHHMRESEDRMMASAAMIHDHRPHLAKTEEPAQ